MNQQLLKGSGLVALIVGGLFLMQQPSTEEVVTLTPFEEEPSHEKVEEEVNETILVDIKGEVIRPGVYELDQTKRVQDAIQLAGGLTDVADDLSVNLSQKLRDEMVIHIPKKGESTTPSTATTSDLISLSHATVQDLQTLPGIGEAKANAIVAYREEHGSFKTVDELTNVAGIGEKTLEGFIDLITP